MRSARLGYNATIRLALLRLQRGTTCNCWSHELFTPSSVVAFGKQQCKHNKCKSRSNAKIKKILKKEEINMPDCSTYTVLFRQGKGRQVIIHLVLHSRELGEQLYNVLCSFLVVFSAMDLQVVQSSYTLRHYFSNETITTAVRTCTAKRSNRRTSKSSET